MASNIIMKDCIDALRKSHPIRNLLHVGNVGKHTLSEYAEWACTAAIFVIPDKAHQLSLMPLIEAHPGWSSLRAVVAASATEREYFNASNPRESGLLSPDSLTGIWRNLKTVSRHSVQVTTLDVAIPYFAANAPLPNWIVVDCLPALPVIQGATSCIEDCDVIMTRAVLDESLVDDPSATLSALDEYLMSRGFLRLAIQEEHHPALGTALFVRDWKSLCLESQRELDSERLIANRNLAVQTKSAADCQMQIGELIADRDEQIRLAKQRASELERAVRACDDHARLLGESQRQIEQLSAERDRIAQNLAAQVRLTADREAAISEISADREQQRQLANQRHKEWKQAIADRDAHAHIADELQEQAREFLRTRDRIERRLTESEEKTAAITAELRERDERIGELLSALNRIGNPEKKGSAELREVRDQMERLNAAFEERGVRIAELETERANLDARQVGLEREMLKAEAQIDLIKDVILRDKAF
jgi:hypothetical protein